jgi:predicted ATPase with chaperone activity
MSDQPASSAVVSSAVLVGVDGVPVTVEALVRVGLPGFTIVGVPDVFCREIRDRVRAAVLSSGLVWPNQHITVTVAPHYDQGRSTGLDLAIAIALVAAAGGLPHDCLGGLAAIGELGLDGRLRPVPGVVPLVECTNAEAFVVVPDASRVDAELAAGRTIRSAPDLRSALQALRDDAPWPALRRLLYRADEPTAPPTSRTWATRWTCGGLSRWPPPVATTSSWWTRTTAATRRSPAAWPGSFRG